MLPRSHGRKGKTSMKMWTDWLMNNAQAGPFMQTVRRLGLGLVLLLAPPALASPSHLDLEAGTDIPISMGMNLASEWDGGWRASTALGYLPQDYVALINTVVQSLPNTYNDATGDLIEQTLQNSLIWRTHVGWQTRFGLYFDAGYTLASLGGGTSTQALLGALINSPPPEQMSPSSNYDVSSSLHLVDVEIGWKKLIAERYTLRLALGFSATVAASASVDAETTPAGQARRRAVDEFERFSEDYLIDTYTSFVHAPSLTIAFGYRLF